MRSFSLVSKFGLILAMLFTTSIVGSAVALAQEQGPPEGPPSVAAPGDQSGDASGAPPGVARLSIITGSNISIKRGDSGDTVAGAINAPLMTGDYLTTGDGSRAEIQIDNNNVIRVGANTQLRIAQLDPNGDDVAQLAAGTAEMRVFNDADAHAEIDTPSIAVRPDSAGAYRVMVDPNGNTEVTVRSGQASLVGPQGTQTVVPGNSVLVSGSASAPQFQTVADVPNDEFDQWNQDRDGTYVAASYQNVNDGVVGADDLANNGQWVNDPSYGQVWAPNVAPGWAPYTDGSWVWANYYGWTWVAAEPWGWAPYHYGRWFYGGNRWMWYPGNRYAVPVYRPALVAFFGFGGGVGLSVGLGFGGFGSIGWIPLGPGDPFHPWWGRGGVTIVNNFNFRSYRNYNAPGWAHGVGVGNWNAGHFNRAVALAGSQIGRAGLVRGTLPIAPTQHNLSYSAHGGSLGHLPEPTARGFASMHSVTAAGRENFAQQRAQITSLSQHPTYTTRSAVQSQRFAQPQAGAQRSAQPASAWDRFNSQRGNQSSNAQRYNENGDQNHSYNSNARTYNSSTRNYNSSTRNYNSNARTYYGSPQRSYTNNARSYNSNARSYGNYQRSAPARSPRSSGTARPAPRATHQGYDE